MDKLQSLGWGILCSLIGGVLGLVALVLLYFLYLKKKSVKVSYYIIGFFAITLIMVAVLGVGIFTTIWWQHLGA